MLKNYLKIAFRNIIRHKGYSIINIAGLGMGMACCIIVLLFVQDELSYDKFHKNAEQIYRIASELDLPTGVMPSTKTRAWMAPNMTNNFPEVFDAVRIYKYGGCVLSYREKRFLEAPFFVDPSFLDVFTFPLVKGYKETALKNPNSALITEELAGKYFGDEDPLGKVLTIDGEYDFIITGVMKNIPQNSHFRCDFFGPIAHLKNTINEKEYNQKEFQVRTYLLLDNNASPKALEEKFMILWPDIKVRGLPQITNFFFSP